MRKLRILTVALAIVGGGAIGTGTAVAEPSCVAQGAISFAPGDLGPTISGYAHVHAPWRHRLVGSDQCEERLPPE